jgi:hypothetical protein
MSNELEDRTSVSDIKEILSQLDSLGGFVEDSADRIKRLVERADKFIQRVGPKIGVEAEVDVRFCRGSDENYSRLWISRWDKGPAADNADGKWHIVYQRWSGGQLRSTGEWVCYQYADDPSYSQSLPSAKLEYRMAALPVLPELLRKYFETAKNHLDQLVAVQNQLDKLETEIEEQVKLKAIDEEWNRAFEGL